VVKSEEYDFMCGIAGALDLSLEPIPDLERRLEAMNRLLQHRGPDGEGVWPHRHRHVGFAHRRLSIIDLESGQQPMSDGGGNWVTYNGEVYNYLELRRELSPQRFSTNSDTEVLLHAYRKWGTRFLDRLRGMFALAIWDEERQELFCARDRFGIKPFYYTVVGDRLYFASEVKALLPFVDQVETDREGFKDYLTFQFCLAGKTLFKGIHELPPAHYLRVSNGVVEVQRYWEVYYDLDFDHTEKYFEEQLQEHILDSVRFHLRSDVPVGAYLSGGTDSSIVSSVASQESPGEFKGFTGKFAAYAGCDESPYARALAEERGFELCEVDITLDDFLQNIRKIIYHLDYPVAGPGSFPQYMVAGLASRHRKVVLGGQGGDEIFGGYARYLIAYFEQCIKAAIDGTMNSGNFIVTYESIIPNLTVLQSYKPLLQEFWKSGLFEDLDRRYFRLVNRANEVSDEINWAALDHYSPFETFRGIFKGDNIQKESYFDSMTHFDFKTLLPALLHVEDRMSMAHGLESRVPFLDHPLIALAATIPSNIKFKAGSMKYILRQSMRAHLPDVIMNRKDKMGFPVPFTDWIQNGARDFVYDVFSSEKAQSRDLVNNRKVLDNLTAESKYGRKIWGLFCLELWQQEFHDRHQSFQKLLDEGSSEARRLNTSSLEKESVA
jgi:asparagine synthase (glutamine-hydrolysing)